MTRRDGRPQLFAPGAALWTDPHISAGMLAAHLDAQTDVASRRQTTIDREVAWLVDHLGLRPGARVLDLGCGPGLYCERLARRGLAVTGVDVSPRSIAWARDSAQRSGLAVEYVEADYRSWEPEWRFDAVLLVFFDLGTLADADRDSLLARISAWLEATGRFVFDVVSAARTVHEEHRWRDEEGGFWRQGPHRVLEEIFDYPSDRVSVDQYTVVDADGSTVYRTWERRYTRAALEAVLRTHGFEAESVWADLTGRAIDESAESMAVVARRL